MYRFASVLFLSVGLGACSLVGPASVEAPSSTTLEQLAQSGTVKNAHNEANLGSAKVSIGAMPRAVAVLPADAGHLEKVANQRYADGVHQTVQYDQAVPGLKANEIDLRLRTSGVTVATVEPLSIEKPSEAGIRAELASNFPRMEMRIADHPRSNAYGVYGFAVGKWANGARCLYAWQWIDSLKTAEGNGAAASVRVRLCRKDGTLDQLANLVDGLTIEPSRLDEDVIASVPEIVEAPKPAAKSRKTAASRRPKRNSDLARANQPRPPLPAQSSTLPPVPSANVSMASSEPPLDPSLPAAAYRGPVLATAKPASR